MISDIRLQHFRSYNDALFECNPHVNIIVGQNGSGKTNLLEAILVLALGSSYRAHDSELIQFEQPWARLDAHDEFGKLRTLKIQTEPRQTKSYELDGRVYQRLTQQHLLPIVLFEPNHLMLLHGSPDLRRTYLDDILEQTTAGYISFRRNYRRVLSQRNSLLKRPSLPSSQELFPWNLRLSELGATIVRSRMGLIETISNELKNLYSSLSGAETSLDISYHPKFPLATYETHMMEKLESHVREDAIRGFTAYGPHREDFTVYFNSVAAAETASRGETRTAILALKIIELQELEKSRNQTPLLLLDDVFSELDGKRRQALTGFVQKYQTFITTTDADLVVDHFTESASVITTSS
jgi:DNA replication and repair protein RecF